jgi:hypothetical protein
LFDGIAAGRIAIYGGEVDPSDKGHEGAGGFTGELLFWKPADKLGSSSKSPAALSSSEPTNQVPDGWSSWSTHAVKHQLQQPMARGWTASAVVLMPMPVLAVFGGLSGNDESPVRLDDLQLLVL